MSSFYSLDALHPGDERFGGEEGEAVGSGMGAATGSSVGLISDERYPTDIDLFSYE